MAIIACGTGYWYDVCRTDITERHARRYVRALEQIQKLFSENESEPDHEIRCNCTFCDYNRENDFDSEPESDFETEPDHDREIMCHCTFCDVNGRNDPESEPGFEALAVFALIEYARNVEADVEADVNDSDLDPPPPYEEVMAEPSSYVEEEMDPIIEFEEDYEGDCVWESDHPLISSSVTTGRLTFIFKMTYVLLLIIMIQMKMQLLIKQLSGMKKVLLVIMRLLKFNVQHCVDRLDKFEDKRISLMNLHDEFESSVWGFAPNSDNYRCTIEMLIQLSNILQLILSIAMTQFLLVTGLNIHLGMKKAMFGMMYLVDLNKRISDGYLETLNDKRRYLRELCDAYDMHDNWV